MANSVRLHCVTFNACEFYGSISNRTGVSVADLIAANGGAKFPTGKIIVPTNNGVKNIVYSRPTTTNIPTPTNIVKVVKAQAGDTVSTVAQRYKL